MGIRSWELGIGRQFLVVSQVNSLHCFICPNVQCPITSDHFYQSNLFWLSCIPDLIIQNYICGFIFSFLLFFLSYNNSHTQHTINFLRINLLKLSFVPDVFRILVFIDPFFNQISSVQSPSFFIRVFRICLIPRHEFPAASSKYNLDAISIRILNKL